MSTEVRVSAGSDDAEQRLSGSVSLSSSDLELTTDGSNQQVVGIRFAGVQVPAGATVTSAWVQFRSDEVSSNAPAALTISAEAADNAPTYSSAPGNVSSRPTAAVTVAWSPPQWAARNEVGPAQRTPDLAPLVQAVIGRSGWAQGNAVALQISGTGTRTADSFEGGASFAPLLHIEYATDGTGGGGGGDPMNQPPTVSAGPNGTVTLPDVVALDGTVSDDGLPDPPAAVTTMWSTVSAPGSVTFADPTAVDTTASFSAPGTYVLRLRADDGAVSSNDEVTVTASTAPGTLPGLIDGVEIESHDRVAPVIDSNGNLYRVTEDYLANGNKPMVMKSADGGVIWAEQDAPGRPTAGDTEGGWLLQDGSTLWFAWQASSKVYLTSFGTSDHPTAPDRYLMAHESVATPSSPGPQYTSLAKNADGSLWVAHGHTPSGGPRSAVVKRNATGGYGTPIVVDSSRTTTAPRLVKGQHDVTHVFYKDHQNDQVYWRSLSTAGDLSTPVRLDTGGTHSIETPLTNAVAYSDGGSEVLVVAFADPAGILKSVEIRGGVVGPERVVSGSAVTINPGATKNTAAVAHLAVAGTTVIAMWGDAADGSVYRDQLPGGGSWGPDVLTVDTGPGNTVQVQYVYVNTLEVTSTQARIGFTYDLGPHVDDDSNIYYDEFDVADPGGGGGPVNQAPTVSAGPDGTVTLPAEATLDGTVADDGLPDPPGVLTTTWTKDSGPGTVTFAQAGDVDTTASFSASGTYVLKLTVDDGAVARSDTVTVVVNPEPGGGGGGGGDAVTMEVRVSAGSDDAEERSSGSMSLNSSDLELTTDGSRQQVVGLRFAGVQVPAGATVTSAWVQFRADEVSSSAAASLTIKAEASDNAPTYSSASGNVTSRATTGSVAWSPPQWTTKNEAGPAQRTPELASLVQAVVGRSGWAQGNAVALQISGTGTRTADSFEGGASFAPLLHIEYTIG